MNFVFFKGHRFGLRFYPFPHLCPIEGCAIAAWLERKHEAWMMRGTR